MASYMTGVPATEMSSPEESDTSVSTVQVVHADVRNANQNAAQQNAATEAPRSRPRRKASRPLLRTAFRNFSGTATVLVGSENGARAPVTFHVHKELLVGASPFFSAALTGAFAEGLDQSVKLPEEKPEIFEWFLQWLYTGSLTTHDYDPPWTAARGAALAKQAGVPMHLQGYATWPQLHEIDARADGDLRNHAGSPKYFLLIDLYGLSDRLLTTELSNHILSTIARMSESTNSVPTPSDIRILYDQIRDNAPLKRLVLDLFAYKKTDKLLATHKDQWHAKFLRDLVVKLKRPGADSVERHTLVAWRPRSWSTTKGCEGCRELLKPDVSHNRCCLCDRAFCAACVRGEAERRTVLGEDTGGCKPWLGRGMCGRYHEHVDGEECE